MDRSQEVWTYIAPADVDGDGDEDVVAASFREERENSTIVWHENIDGTGVFRDHRIDVVRTSVESAFPLDVDGDGDFDLLATGRSVTWYENTDGKGAFAEPKAIGAAGGTVLTADIDGDAKLDLVVAGNSGISYGKLDETGTFVAGGIVTRVSPRRWSVFAADIDDDGDIDVGSIDRSSSVLTWHENTNGQGMFDKAHVIQEGEFGRSAFAVDVDSDGDIDLLASESQQVVWYENLDGKGTFGDKNVLQSEYSPSSIVAADLDGDGDMDVLSESWGRPGWPPRGYDSKLVWYENSDGRGDFTEAQIITTNIVGVRTLYAADVNGDGDLDAIASSEIDGKIAWYEQLPQVTPGDANGDLKFDQLDIVQVLQADKYLTGQTASFEEGDWNSDGVFDQLDIVAALQAGDYLAERIAAREQLDNPYAQTDSVLG